jgi:hypothetical protein
MRTVCCLGLCWVLVACAAPSGGARRDSGGSDAGTLGDALPAPLDFDPAHLSLVVLKRGRAYVTAASGTPWVRPQDHVDLLATLPDAPRGAAVTVSLIENVIVLDRRGDGRLALLVLPEEAELIALSQRLGSLHVSRRHPKDPGIVDEPRRVDDATVILGERAEALREVRRKRFPRAFSPPGEAPPAGARELALAVSGAELAVPGDRVDLIASLEDAVRQDAVAFTLLEDVLVTRRSPAGHLGLLLLPEEVALVAHVAGRGTIGVALRHPEDLSSKRSRGPAMRTRVVHGSPTHTLNDAPRYARIRKIKIPRNLPGLGLGLDRPDARP